MGNIFDFEETEKMGLRKRRRFFILTIGLMKKSFPYWRR